MTVAVAHRLATIRNADEILAMVDGVIVERGLHEELVAADNVYASQWRIQTGELDSRQHRHDRDRVGKYTPRGRGDGF